MIFRSFAFLALALLLMSHVSIANESTWHPLWPGDPPGMTVGTPMEGDLPAYQWAQVQSDVPSAAIVILPGGGYGNLALDHEGDQIATWLGKLGISSLICKYRHRGQGNDGEGYGHPYPMLDAQRAIQTVRSRAKEWNVDLDRVGVLGFSAGGHLASTVSTKFAEVKIDSVDLVARFSSRPDFSVLCYPVICFGKRYTHRGSQRNLLGKDASASLIASLSSERHVSDKTPPTFLWHTAEDPTVPVENSLQYFRACKEQGVEAELHVFPKGGHGLGLAAGVEGTEQWPDLCAAWLLNRSLGFQPGNDPKLNSN